AILALVNGENGTQLMAQKRKTKKTPPTVPVSKQGASPSYRIPALDQDFILSDRMRRVRFLLEYAKAEHELRAYGIRSTIVVFGSARVSEKGPGERRRRWYAE